MFFDSKIPGWKNKLLLTFGGTMLKKSFTKATLLGSLLFSTQVLAVDLTVMADSIKQSSQKISNLAERIEFGNARPRATRNLRQELTLMINKAEDMKALLAGQGGNGPGPRPRPNPRPHPRPLPPVGPMYTAKCHIDDDPDLTFNQNVVDVRGETISLLIEDCSIMAQAMYPSKNHSAGIKDIQLSGAVPVGMQTGECHIDDDPDMTFNQIVEGTIYGATIGEIISDCKQLGELAYGQKSSSGLKTINKGVSIPRNAVSGVCHIDDDPDMTFDQFVPGVVFGPSVQAISADCSDLAIATYGNNSASGLMDIKR